MVNFIDNYLMIKFKDLIKKLLLFYERKSKLEKMQRKLQKFTNKTEIMRVKNTKNETSTDSANKSDLKTVNWQYRECLLF